MSDIVIHQWSQNKNTYIGKPVKIKLDHRHKLFTSQSKDFVTKGIYLEM